MKKTFGKVIFCAINLALAIFSATVGIYAIISAEMKMTVNMGYLAYNCSANVSGVITGASLDGESAPSDIQLSNVVVDGLNSQTQAMNLGTFYFTTNGIKNALGKPYPIKAWFTIQNTSEFAICVDVSLPTITDVEVVADKTSHIIQAGETDKIMITFTLTNITTSALSDVISVNGLKFTFRKFLKTKQDIVVYKDATATRYESHPYYIKYGSPLVYGTELLWLVAGTVNSSGQMVALTSADKAQLDTGKFAANTNYYMVSCLALYGGVTNNFKYVPYQNNFYYDTGTSSACYLLEYPHIQNVADYSLSTTREYLNNRTVKTGVKNADTLCIEPGTVDLIGFVDAYSLEDDLIYPLIQKRSLSDIYKTLGLNSQPLSFPTGQADNLTENETDAFWLPTQVEMELLSGALTAYAESGSAKGYYVYTNQDSRTPQYVGNYNTNGTLSKIAIRYSIEQNIRPAFII